VFNKIKGIRYSKDMTKVKRMVLASAQAITVPKISEVFRIPQKLLSTVAHNFNKDGFKSLKLNMKIEEEKQK